MAGRGRPQDDILAAVNRECGPPADVDEKRDEATEAQDWPNLVEPALNAKDDEANEETGKREA